MRRPLLVLGLLAAATAQNVNGEKWWGGDDGDDDLLDDGDRDSNCQGGQIKKMENATSKCAYVNRNCRGLGQGLVQWSPGAERCPDARRGASAGTCTSATARSKACPAL